MLDLKQTISDLPPASFSTLEPARRLLVLIPPFDINLSAFTQRVWEIANATGSNIQFLSLVAEANSESKARRELACISAMFKSTQVEVQTKIESGKDWVDILQIHLQAGDMLICLAEHRIGSTNKPLSQILESKFDNELYVLSDLITHPESDSNRLSQIMAWVGSLAIILGYFMLQVRIIDFTKGSTQTLFLLISLPIGFGLLWAWNSLFG